MKQTACTQNESPLHTHLCFLIRVGFLLGEQIEAGHCDDVRSLVRSVQTMMRHNRAIKKLKTIYTAMTVSMPMDNRKRVVVIRGLATICAKRKNKWSS